ncbi:hypothetical protein K474DRAFT_1608345, partial [Panus rudis PR-1116 ss-1]
MLAVAHLAKSRTAQILFLHSLSHTLYDLVLIQEPYLDFKALTRATSFWRVVYPHRHHDHPDRVLSRSPRLPEDTYLTLILVNTSISTGSWTSLDLPSMDITAIRIATETGPLIIFNIYN